MNEEAEFIAAVEEGLRALEEGRVVSHEEVKARFEWLHKFLPAGVGGVVKHIKITRRRWSCG